MSSLIFYTQEDQVLVATDTLAVSPDGRALMFTTKVLIVPHLRMMMAGTGAGGFLDRWFVRVNSAKVVADIDNLNYHTPKSLADLWLEFKKENGSIPGGLTTTVYHFGFSEATDRIRAYAYRSENDFTSEPLKYGLAVKPECTVPDNFELPRDIRTMMDGQRAIQRSFPSKKRIYIGGEIQIHHLMRAGFNVYRLDRFDDFDADARIMFERCRGKR
jgi:hypothetical protein